MDPVEHEPAGSVLVVPGAVAVTVIIVVLVAVVVGVFQGVATARRGRARVVKATARENILDVAWLVSTRRSSVARVGLN